MTPILTAPGPSIVDVHVENLPSRHGSHKAATLTIQGLGPDSNRVEFSPGTIGMKRLKCLTPTPLGEPFSVAWNGDAANPALVFDGWQEGDTRVQVEAWGV